MDPDRDPASHFDADSDPDQDPTFHFYAVPNLDPSFPRKAQNLEKVLN